MDKFKRTFSFRKKKDHVPESSKPHQWQEDEQKVRDGTCSFQVRYLGCIEVFESRGIHVCEEAVKALKAKKNRSVWKRMSLRRKKKDKDAPIVQQCKGKYQRAILYVSGDALRVVDEISKGLIVDQTIEKVSFCAPDRNHEKGFAYICRDGTTRRWMCHGFLAVKESHGDRKANFGERLSHAVGCAFAICLEKKQKREKESVTVTYNDKGTSFTRLGSFRQASLTERMQDPQSTIIPDPVPVVKQEPGGGISNVPMPASAIERPRASVDVLQRQASFRGFNKLAESSPFKRQLSLRLNELPSTLERQGHVTNNNNLHPNGPVSPIAEASPTKEQGLDSITEMCAQLSQGLTALTEDPFSPAPKPAASAGQPTSSVGPPAPSSGQQQGLAMLHTQTAVTHINKDSVSSTGYIPTSTVNNPWGSGANQQSDAEFWLQQTATAVSSQPATDPFASSGTTTATMNGTVVQPTQPQVDPFTNAAFPVQAQVHPAVRAPHLSAHLRSHSMDSGVPAQWNQQASQQQPPQPQQQRTTPPFTQLAQDKGQGPRFQSQQQTNTESSKPASPWQGNVPTPAQNDPFDAAWMSRSPNRPATNPFQAKQTQDANVTKAFTVNL